MHELKVSALRTRDRYYSIRVCHIKTCSLAKCYKRFIADCVTYSQSRTSAQPLVDPVLTAFDWISVYYTALASQLEAVFVCQSG